MRFQGDRVTGRKFENKIAGLQGRANPVNGTFNYIEFRDCASVGGHYREEFREVIPYFAVELQSDLPHTILLRCTAKFQVSLRGTRSRTFISGGEETFQESWSLNVRFPEPDPSIR